jgi:imidazolonepropionase-like amidohydrolase
MTEEAVAKRRREMAQPEGYAGIRRAAEAGVRVAFGTDAGSPVVPHNEIVSELKYMITAGVCADSWAALRSITMRASELLQLDTRLGTVSAGKTADLLVVRGDPVTDLESLRNVERVYVNGRLAFRESGGYAQVC